MRTRSLGMLAAVLWVLPAAMAPAQVKTETEPNNARAQAQELRIGDRIEGVFQTAGDNDYFKLVVDKPDKHEIDVTLGPVSTLEAHAEIQDKDGRPLWPLNQASKGEAESVSHIVVTEGVYFLRIHGRGDNPTDKYTLSIRSLGPWKEGSEAEPNDEIKQATELRLDVPMTGRINRFRDVDVYALTIPEPGREILVFQITGIPGDVSVRVMVAPQPLEIKATITSGAALAFTLKKVKGQWVLE